MGLSNYAELKEEILEHLVRDDLSDGNVDTLIDLAESRHKRDIRIREMIARSHADVSTRFVALPPNFIELISFKFLTNPVTVLQQVSPYEMSRRRQEAAGSPKYFTIHEEIELDRAPDSSTAEVIFYQSFKPLSEENTINDLLLRAPDVYLYGALMAAAPFLQHDERIKVWSTFYDEAVDAMNKTDRARRGGPVAAKVAGDTP